MDYKKMIGMLREEKVRFPDDSAEKIFGRLHTKRRNLVAAALSMVAAACLVLVSVPKVHHRAPEPRAMFTVPSDSEQLRENARYRSLYISMVKTYKNTKL